MSAKERPFASVVVPFPWPGVCTHPLIRCVAELDEEKRRVLACECGAVREVKTEYERMWWFDRRLCMVARAIQDHLGGAEIDRLMEGI